MPDYPEPRTLTLGGFYWLTGPGISPSFHGGNQAPDYETLTDWGRAHKSPGIEASLPITRTGELKFEYFRIKGDGNQDAPAAIDIFGTSYAQGTFLATQYQLQSARLYLDDLLFPHKFPVAKFRLKSLWEVEWVSIKNTIDAPILDAEGTPASATASRQIIYPAFGLAAEYALTPHILLRAQLTGFGLPHHADIADGEATISYRLGGFEVRGGAKALHFKSTPQTTAYEVATFTGAFVGIRWHWSL